MPNVIVSGSLCSELRQRAEAGVGAADLAEEYGISRGAVRYHIYGECNHEVAPDALTPSEKGVSAAECRTIRSRYAAGDDVDDIADDLDHTWKTTVRHLAGECQHGGGELVVPKREVLKRMPVTERDCASLRRTYVEEGEPELLPFSRNTPWTYQTVLRHVNGECDHDVDAPSRVIRKRAQISEAQCHEFRRRYRENTDLTLSNLDPLVTEYEASAGSIRRHIRFRCHHDPESTLLNEIGGWESLVDADPLQAGDEEDAAETAVHERPEPRKIVETAAGTGVRAPDEHEAVADLPAPDADRVETTTARIVRKTDQSKELEERYQHRCQLCGTARHRGPLARYAETHHLKPVGRPHEGPDEPSNTLVLCPNHHADFDHGLVHVDPDTLEVTHATDEAISGQELHVRDDHQIDRELLAYHNEKISRL